MKMTGHNIPVCGGTTNVTGRNVGTNQSDFKDFLETVHFPDPFPRRIECKRHLHSVR